jgi:predicted TIM-barrel fold metal-dependent hydrolase
MKKNQDFVGYLDENGIDRCVVNTISKQVDARKIDRLPPSEYLSKIKDPKFDIFEAFRTNGQPNHDEVIDLSRKFPDRIFPFFWYNPVDPEDPGQEHGIKEVKKSMQNGFKGVKLQLSMTPCEVERLFPIAQLLVEKDLPLYIHPSGGVFSTQRTSSFFIIDLAKKFPDLKLIVGHSCYTMEFCVELTMLMNILPEKNNVYFETSVSILYGILSYIKKYGAGKVIFGSDSPTAVPFSSEYDKIMYLRLSQKEKEMILSKNIERLLNLD